MAPPRVPAAERQRRLFDLLSPGASPLDLRILGRTLWHAALIGALAGIAGTVFFYGLELAQRFFLEGLAGFVPLRAHGEAALPHPNDAHFRPALLVLLPALGGLLGGLLTARWAPEAMGGGADASIDAFHRHGGVIRRRVIWIKMLASILTLGTGGAGGREGPTMHFGGAIGSWVGRLLGAGPRERRILLVVGVAAGISAVFRTPLGAALLAVEVLYRDDFEADALVPAVLASVVSYSVVISFIGETTLFAHAARYPFVPQHLPLYGLMAILVALVAALFVATLRMVQRVTQQLGTRLHLPLWLRPGLGGLCTGLLCTPIILLVRGAVGTPGQGLGLLGGSYGAAQLAITGAPWLPGGWTGIELLAVLCAGKLLATCFTVGSGGSAGDFAPSLALGGIVGGIFGRLLQLVIHDPRIDPGAFALVAMGSFYGGIAHVPLSSMVLVCELAGSYDLLVPLMLAEGIAFVALRKRSLYPAQVPTRRDSPAHRDTLVLDVLKDVPVKRVMTQGRPYVSFSPSAPARRMVQDMAESTWQDVFPVVDEGGVMRGVVTADSLRLLTDQEVVPWTIAADIMHQPVTVHMDTDLRAASQIMLEKAVRELPVIDDSGKIVGFIDAADIAQAYLHATVGDTSPG